MYSNSRALKVIFASIVVMVIAGGIYFYMNSSSGGDTNTLQETTEILPRTTHDEFYGTAIRQVSAIQTTSLYEKQYEVKVGRNFFGITPDSSVIMSDLNCDFPVNKDLSFKKVTYNQDRDWYNCEGAGTYIIDY